MENGDEMMYYWNPTHGLWLVGAGSLIIGAIVGAGDTILPQIAPLADFIRELTGPIPASVMIVYGLGAITTSANQKAKEKQAAADKKAVIAKVERVEEKI